MIHRYKRDAAEEFLEAVRAYEKEKPGLGGDFLNDVDHAIRVIKKSPQRWPLIDDRFRRYRLDRFPYGIVYEVPDSVLAITAVMHLHRRAGYWRSRVP